MGRRVTMLCKGEDGLRQQLALYHVYDNFVLPHASLRQPLLVQSRPTMAGLRKGVAAVYAGDGRRVDRPRVVAARSVDVTRAAVAPTPCTVTG